MKRVERCGTLESQQQQAANQSGQQHQQHQPRSSSHANIPLSQSSDRSIHRSDTILTHQPSHIPSAFSQPQPQSHSQSTRDRDALSSSSHTRDSIQHTFVAVQSSSVLFYLCSKLCPFDLLLQLPDVPITPQTSTEKHPSKNLLLALLL